MSHNRIRILVLSALFLAIGLVLPFLTGQIPQIGGQLCPMHIPALMCGFVCGAPMAALVGFIMPILRSLIFGLPPMIPTALAMAFELAAYGFAAGLLFRLLPRKKGMLYVALIAAMLIGRAVWAAASVPLYMLASKRFTWTLFLASGFVNAVPGIILHIALIPPLVLALERAGLIADKPR